MTEPAITITRVRNGWIVARDHYAGETGEPLWVAKSIDDLVSVVVEWGKASRGSLPPGPDPGDKPVETPPEDKPAGPVVGEVE